jgi:3-deoxy-7-phosphoheptulonate synthase/chorismate mutase
MEHNLKKLRQQMEQVNMELLHLLNERTQLIQEIGLIQEEINIECFDPLYESKMFETLFAHNRGPLSNEMVKEVFTSIFATSHRQMGLERGKELLIASEPQDPFLSVQQIFKIGPEIPFLIAGPCAVERADYLESIAGFLRRNHLKFLRGGAFKPRTSPYEFQGLGEAGLKILHDVGAKYNLYTITEIVDPRDIEIASNYVDIFQIGARNMQNYELLKEVGQADRPVVLKRGLSATIQEWMFAAEYIGLQGNRKIILCERGIRTFETKTRNTLDISSIAIIKKETRLPVIVDLSHSLGRKDIIVPLAKAALAVGADGIMIEVHPYPELALSDSKQQLNPGEFQVLLDNVYNIRVQEKDDSNCIKEFT